MRSGFELCQPPLHQLLLCHKTPPRVVNVAHRSFPWVHGLAHTWNVIQILRPSRSLIGTDCLRRVSVCVHSPIPDGDSCLVRWRSTQNLVERTLAHPHSCPPTRAQRTSLWIDGMVPCAGSLPRRVQFRNPHHNPHRWGRDGHKCRPG